MARNTFKKWVEDAEHTRIREYTERDGKQDAWVVCRAVTSWDITQKEAREYRERLIKDFGAGPITGYSDDGNYLRLPPDRELFSFEQVKSDNKKVESWGTSQFARFILFDAFEWDLDNDDPDEHYDYATLSLSFLTLYTPPIEWAKFVSGFDDVKSVELYWMSPYNDDNGVVVAEDGDIVTRVDAVPGDEWWEDASVTAIEDLVLSEDAEDLSDDYCYNDGDVVEFVDGWLEDVWSDEDD